ncbi:UNVERIFIED_CONTAM: hypothetical protein NCL1_18316 [Trichonephila clavipes]
MDEILTTARDLELEDDFLGMSREEKDEYAKKLMDEMKQKNERIKKRHANSQPLKQKYPLLFLILSDGAKKQIGFDRWCAQNILSPSLEVEEDRLRAEARNAAVTSSKILVTV